MRIRGIFEPDKGASETLGDFHAYELKLGNANLSIIYVGGNEFVTADNLERVAFLLDPTEKLSGDYTDAAKGVFDQLLAENNRAKEKKPTSCWLRSMAGSQRGSTPKICRRPKPC